MQNSLRHSIQLTESTFLHYSFQNITYERWMKNIIYERWIKILQRRTTTITYSTSSYKSKKTCMKKTRRKLDNTKKIRLRTIFIWRYDSAKKIRTTSENPSILEMNEKCVLVRTVPTRVRLPLASPCLSKCGQRSESPNIESRCEDQHRHRLPAVFLRLNGIAAPCLMHVWISLPAI